MVSESGSIAEALSIVGLFPKSTKTTQNIEKLMSENLIPKNTKTTPNIEKQKKIIKTEVENEAEVQSLINFQNATKVTKNRQNIEEVVIVVEKMSSENNILTGMKIHILVTNEMRIIIDKKVEVLGLIGVNNKIENCKSQEYVIKRMNKTTKLIYKNIFKTKRSI